MSEIPSAAYGAPPTLDLDPFSEAFLAEPFAAWRELQELAPVVSLPRYGIYAVARHREVRQVLHDVSTFISSAGVGLANLRSEKPFRPPSLVLEADPPAHARPRAVLGRVLSAERIAALRAGFRAEAVRSVDRAVGRGAIDGIAELARAYPLQVFPDAVGLGSDERENLLAYAEMVFNADGPENALFLRTAQMQAPLSEWIMERCRRSSLLPGGLGAEVYAAMDRGELDAREAPLLVRSLLSAGIDTTVAAIGNALWCLAAHPDQWRELRRDPELVRQAFDETLRYESPATLAFRTTSRPARIGGFLIPDNRKVVLLLGAANRDPRRWSEADRFDLHRRPIGHLAFGSGIHACVGQLISRAEAEELLAALVQRVRRIELDGPPRRRLNNSVRSLESLPLRLVAA